MWMKPIIQAKNAAQILQWLKESDIRLAEYGNGKLTLTDKRNDEKEGKN